MEILENEKNMTIIEDNGFLYLFSYNSKIACYNKLTNGMALGRLWNYSQTTLKHLKHFVNTYTNYSYKSKQDFQKIVDNYNGKENNILETYAW